MKKAGRGLRFGMVIGSVTTGIWAFYSAEALDVIMRRESSASNEWVRANGSKRPAGVPGIALTMTRSTTPGECREQGRTGRIELCWSCRVCDEELE